MVTKLVFKPRPLGDNLIFIAIADKYQKDTGEIVYVELYSQWISMLDSSYPNLKLSNFPPAFDKVIEVDYEFIPYASLQSIFAKQLGYDINKWEYQRPRLDTTNVLPPQIKSKYVVIGVHSTAQFKYWNHPQGKNVQSSSPNWELLTKMLKKKGYTVLCFEKNEFYGGTGQTIINGLPKSSNNKIGKSWEEIISHLKHAKLFIGLSSGLTWLAHSLNTPVCMIANFTKDYNEIGLECEDYIRITNPDVCHGCMNAVGDKYTFDSNNWNWCPEHEGTAREFECHKSIIPQEVFNILLEEKWV